MCNENFNKNSSIPNKTKNPIVLNRNHILTALIVQACLHCNKHNEERLTPSEARKEYWVRRGKRFIEQTSYYCIICRH